MINFLQKILPSPVRKTIHKLVIRLVTNELYAYKVTSRIGIDSPNQWIKKSAHIGGWLFPGEHEFLWELACRSKEGHILEIGTWLGKSTCILAGACIEKAPHTKVLCLDPFDMSGTSQQKQYHKRLVTNVPGTFYQFTENAKRLGFIDWVMPVATTSDMALSVIDLRFRMVFIDATHDYDGVKKDVELSLPKILKGGLLVLHDATNSSSWPGVQKYVDESLRCNQTLRFLSSNGTTVAFEKIEE